MWNLNFYKTTRISSISKYQSDHNSQKDILIQKITQEIQKLDQKITTEAQDLFQTEVTGIKAALSRNNSWFNKLQNKVYRSKIENSAKWQRDQIKQLFKEKLRLQIQLDRLTGKFWVKQIRKWLTLFLCTVFFFLAIWVIFMGVITTLYLLPIWGSILIAYIFYQRKSNKLY